MWRTIGCGLAAMVGLMTGSVCSAGSSDEITPFPKDWPHRAPWKLNRELLTPQTGKIVFVVEVVRGAPPLESALDHLVETAARYGQREAVWIHAGTPGAPDVRWVVPEEPPTGSAFTIHLPAEQIETWRMSQDLFDDARSLREVVDCPEGPLPEGTSFVFVRYLGEWEWGGGAYGAATRKQGSERCGSREFPIIYVAQNNLRKHQVPGFGRDFLEPRDLVHEYGHLLGLGSNPAHARTRSTLPDTRGGHCVNRECAVAIPSTMALLKRKMQDYCEDCQRDIEQAREHWATGRVFPEVPRIETPDATDVVSGLKKYSFAEGGRAERVVRFGKEAVPPLIERIPDLPGSRDPSPKFFAVGLVKRILVIEDRKRREDGDELRYVSPRDERTEALLRWWVEQGEAFMSGDDWTLPAGVVMTVPAND